MTLSGLSFFPFPSSFLPKYPTSYSLCLLTGLYLRPSRWLHRNGHGLHWHFFYTILYKKHESFKACSFYHPLYCKQNRQGYVCYRYPFRLSSPHFFVVCKASICHSIAFVNTLCCFHGFLLFQRLFY